MKRIVPQGMVDILGKKRSKYRKSRLNVAKQWMVMLYTVLNFCAE